MDHEGQQQRGIERRACIRFEVPGATVSHKEEKFFLRRSNYGEEFCPVIDISRGGLRFLCQKSMKINTKVRLKIALPGERIPLILKGQVRWSAPNPGKSYRYQVGVQFNPYGEKSKQNYPGALVKIIALEQKFAPSDKSELEQSKKEEFETDSD